MVMDPRRLSSADILYGGILGKPAPETDIPEDREVVQAVDDFEVSFIGADVVVEALLAGKVVRASNYYGIPYVWKKDDGVYRAVLLQYRNITEDVTFATAREAAEWFEDRFYATDG